MTQHGSTCRKRTLDHLTVCVLSSFDQEHLFGDMVVPCSHPAWRSAEDLSFSIRPHSALSDENALPDLGH